MCEVPSPGFVGVETGGRSSRLKVAAHLPTVSSWRNIHPYHLMTRSALPKPDTMVVDVLVLEQN